MKSLVFDAGPVISLATNNLLFILKPLKKKFNGNFFITESVKRELVDRPFEIKKFKFEAIQVEKLIEQGTLEIIDNDSITEQAPKILETANNIFRAFDNCIKIVHYAEMSVIAAAKNIGASAIVIDEKTTRLLIEEPKELLNILRKTLNTPVILNEKNLAEFRGIAGDIKTIRSVELAALAFEYGMLDSYVTKMPDARKSLLESVLWGVKMNGCAVSGDEIEQIMRKNF